MDVARIGTILSNSDPMVWVVLGSVVAGILLLGALIGWGVASWRRRRRLKKQFGPEYERLQDERGDSVAAEAELQRRQQRVQQFDIRLLSPQERDRFGREWKRVQSRFVDSPSRAVEEADELVAQVMHARGYPVGDFEQRAEDLSVDHPHVVQNYRQARAFAERNSRGEADTEELRQAMVHYRSLFDDLLESAEHQPTDAPRPVEAT